MSSNMTKEKTEELGKTQDRTADKGNRVYSMKIIKIIYVAQNIKCIYSRN